VRILRLRVEQLRQFSEPFELTGFDPGINLFTGSNEAGKSTLVRAIRAAFFERHRSTSVEDLRPWDDPGAAPAVEIDFEIGDTRYRLRKTFLRKARCHLEWPGGSLDGDEAEAMIAGLLGFELPQRGASRREHWGIPGLLWMEQGTSHEIAPAVQHAAEHLRGALERCVGEVASSQGDALIARVRDERGRLLTAAVGRPTGDYQQALEALASAEATLRQLDERVAQYQADVDQLAELTAIHAAESRDPPWEAAEAGRAEAERALAALATLRAELTGTEASVAAARLRHQLALGRLAAIEERRAQLRHREHELTEVSRRAEIARLACDARGRDRAEAQDRLHAATEALARARSAELHAELSGRIDATGHTLEALAQALGQAEREHERVLALQRIGNERMVTRADLDRLRELQASVGALRVRQEAAATRLRFALRDDSGVTLDNGRVSPREERLLSAAAEVHIPGIGSLHILPGGTDLATIGLQLAEAQDALETLLRGLDAASVDEIEARRVRHEQAAVERRQAEQLLAAVAPEGIDALRLRRDALAAQQVRDQERLAVLSPLAEAAEAPDVATAMARCEALRARLDSHDRETQELAARLLRVEADLANALRERDALRDTLESDALLQEEREALHMRDEAAVLVATLERESTHRRDQLQEARPDILEQDLERYRLSIARMRQAFDELTERIHRLRGRLDETGAQGLEEERALQAARVAAATRRARELERRARALDLLLQLLEDGRRDLTRRLHAPLRHRLTHYLHLLFPRAELSLGEDLAPGRLKREGSRGAESGEVEDLSHGAREQLGVITRLAYADLLREAGRPTLVILDDALVHTDVARLAAMKRVLFDASRRHQVLIFTCHPGAWRDLGVAPQAIESRRGTRAAGDS
jgi:energy-coupling factor transporter ATP-binding protein EcfA2